MPGTFDGWQMAKYREAVVGSAVTVDGDEPVVLATGIEHGCTVVWFAVSSSGGKDGRIGGVTASDGIEILIPRGCHWEMRLSGGNLTCVRTAGTDTLEISVLVVKL